MATRTHQHNDVALPTIGEHHETDISLESDVDYRAWKPDRNVKMALAVQTFCVVRWNSSQNDRKVANNHCQFIISIDMTILTATLPVSAK
jgi:hypothetical protein